MKFDKEKLGSLGHEYRGEMERLTELAIEMHTVQKRLKVLRKKIDKLIREARRDQG